MAVRRVRVQRAADEPHNFFISMTDMMVGMIFLFIIMLMFFALKLERAASQGVNLIASLTTTEEVRATILVALQDDMARQGIQVLTNPQQGVLSLSETILFDKGKAELSRRGEEAVERPAGRVERGVVLPAKADEHVDRRGAVEDGAFEAGGGEQGAVRRSAHHRDRLGDAGKLRELAAHLHQPRRVLVGPLAKQDEDRHPSSPGKATARARRRAPARKSAPE